MLILSHPSVGGFRGWNSTLESVYACVPMITWPLVVQVLGISVGVRPGFVVHVGEEEQSGVKLKSEGVKNAFRKVMGDRIEGNERQKRAKEVKSWGSQRITR